MEVVVFSKNQFEVVKVPAGMEGEEYFYGTFLLHLVNEKGLDAGKAKRITEAAVYKRLYPGLIYGKELEEELANAGFSF